MSSNQIYFVNSDHEKNFKEVLIKWPSGHTNSEYRAALYILAVPVIFNNVKYHLPTFKTPVDWIWRWEMKSNRPTLDTYHDEEDEEEEEDFPYDLTGSMIEMGRLALNLWNSYEHFNLMNCIARVDEKNYQVVKTAMDIRCKRIQ